MPAEHRSPVTYPRPVRPTSIPGDASKGTSIRGNETRNPGMTGLQPSDPAVPASHLNRLSRLVAIGRRSDWEIYLKAAESKREREWSRVAGSIYPVKEDECASLDLCVKLKRWLPRIVLHFVVSTRLTVIPLMGLSSASRKRAQKSVAPPPLMTAARTTLGPLFSVSRLETPSSMTVWRSP